MSNTAESSPPPVVCTLGEIDQSNPGPQWADLVPLALRSERIEGGVSTTYPIEIADKVDGLVAQESSCCGSWLNVSSSRSVDTIRVDFTTANPEGLAMIETMAGLKS